MSAAALECCPSFRDRGQCAFGSACPWPHTPNALTLAPPPTPPTAVPSCSSYRPQRSYRVRSSMLAIPALCSTPDNLVVGAPAAALLSSLSSSSSSSRGRGYRRGGRGGGGGRGVRSHPFARDQQQHTGSGRGDRTGDVEEKGQKEEDGGVEELRHFHNLIKRNLLDTYGQRYGYVVDLASGKGGDFKKFQHISARHVWGCDISPEHVRLAQERLENDSLLRIWSLAKRLQNGQHENIKVSLTVVDLNDMEAADKSYWSVVPDGEVGTACCFFALHYFARSAKQLTQLLERVAKKLQHGSFFIGCCPDGDYIQSKTEAELKTKQMTIQKLLAAHEGENTRIIMTMANSIIEVGSAEFVVTRQLLSAASAAAGLVVHSIDNFDAWLSILESTPSVQSNYQARRAIEAVKSSADLRATSVSNMSFVLRKPRRPDDLPFV